MKTLQLTAISLTSFIIAGCGTQKAALQEPVTLRILSYNIRHGEGMDKRIGLKRIAGVIAKKNPDLVALQEIDNNCRRSGKTDIAAVLGNLLDMEHHFGEFMNFQGGQYGLAALSLWPVKESIRHELPKGAEPRCALEIIVQPPHMNTPLSFVCIHNTWTKENIRLKQVQTLIKALKGRKHPVILAGDFNGERNDASLKLLEKDGWTILKKDDRSAKLTFPSDKPEVEIDFFIVKGIDLISVEHKVIDERVASDHRPISAVIKFQ